MVFKQNLTVTRSPLSLGEGPGVRLSYIRKYPFYPLTPKGEN